MLGYVLGQKEPNMFGSFFFFNVTCLRNDRKCSDTCTCNSPWPFECHPRQDERDRKKKERKTEREKGKVQWRCYSRIQKTKKKNDPSVIVFHLQKLCWSYLVSVTEIVFLQICFFFLIFFVSVVAEMVLRTDPKHMEMQDELYDERRRNFVSIGSICTSRMLVGSSTWVWLLPSKCKRP